MTEKEWLTCADPQPMLESLRGKASDRKLRLFALAGLWPGWSSWRDPTAQHLIAVIERFAEGVATEAEYAAAFDAGRGTAYLTALYSFRYRPPAVSAGFAARALEPDAQCRLLRDLFGNPFRPVALDPAWRTPDVLTLAQAAYDNRALPAGTLEPARLGLLADALEEAGCDNADLLGHLRSEGPHVRGCWCVDLCLGRE